MSVSAITRFPSGLLDLLGTKGTGQNPAFLLGDVRPSIELLEFYLATSPVEQIELPIVTQTAALGYRRVTNLVVPATEIWILAGYTGFMECSAIQGFNGCLTAFGVGNTVSVTNAVLNGVHQSVSANQARGFSLFSNPSLLFMPPSSGLGTCIGVSTNDPTFALCAQFHRFKL